MPEYHAKPGQEDRHGEMTGAISLNMMLSMPPVMVWAVLIGPALLDNVWLILGIALAIAAVLPFLFMPLSRRTWAWVSHWMDGRR